VPAQQGIGGDNRRDLAQPPTAQAVRPHGQPAPVVIGQVQAPPAHLPPQEAVLFDQVGEHLPFPAIEPAGYDHQ